MSDTDATPALKLIASRLKTLTAMLDKAEGLWAERDLDMLAGARIAPDMHPLAWQVSATATQSELFVAWCRGEERSNAVTAPTTWADARAQLATALANVETAVEAAAETGAVMPETRHIRLDAIGMCLDLPGPRYLDDWILPNLYFHLITTYAIMRLQGMEFGKADFMAHIAGDIRPIAPLPA